MVRHDWSPRPALAAYEDLVFKQWWTRWAGRTDGDGLAHTRAFYGRHRVTARLGRARATAIVELLPRGEGTVRLVLRKGDG